MSRLLKFLLVLSALALSFTAVRVSRYNMTVSDTHNFVWFRVGKTGTRTILRMLNDSAVPFVINDSEVPYKPDLYKDHFKFTFVRNPWDRVVSCYCDKVLKVKYKPFRECAGKGFDYFVDFISRQNLAKADRHIMLQTELIPLDEVDFIGRLENFEEDLRHVLHTIGIYSAEIPKKNTTSHEHYSRYYTERTKRIIAEKYRKDIEAFGYEFEQE